MKLLLFVMLVMLPLFIESVHAQCFVPDSGKTIDQDVTFCAGTYIITTPMNVTTDSLTIDGAGATLQGDGGDSGILADNRDGIVIQNMDMQGFTDAIHSGCNGLCPPLTNSLIRNITFDDIEHAVMIWGAADNVTIQDNMIQNPKRAGIRLQGLSGASSGITIDGNTIDGCTGGFIFEGGIRVEKADLSFITSNTITNCNGLNTSGIWMIGGGPTTNTTSNQISGNIISQSRNGIILWEKASGNFVFSNVIEDNTGIGIYLKNVEKNTLANNTFKDLSLGIKVDPFSGGGPQPEGAAPADPNTIYVNNFENNAKSVEDNDPNTIWNATYFIGSFPFLVGNHWSDFDQSSEGCIDTDHDQICDDPFIFDPSDPESSEDPMPVVSYIYLAGVAPPDLAFIDNVTLDEAGVVTLILNAIAATPVTYSVDSPEFIQTSPNTFVWYTDFDTAGVHEVNITAIDEDNMNDGQVVSIAVNDMTSECGAYATLKNSCIATTSASFVLTDQVLPDGITIAGDGITFDCGSSIMRGLSLGEGIRITGDNVQLSNCEIRDFQTGILSQDDNAQLLNNKIYDSQEYGIHLFNTNTNLVSGNFIRDSLKQGIRLDGTTQTTIDGNTLLLNERGLFLTGSSSNTISNNLVYKSPSLGIRITSGSTSNTLTKNNFIENEKAAQLSTAGNTFTLNNFVGNVIQATSVTGNSWDSLGMGNYWSDFSPTCPDADTDGICDAPYLVDPATGEQDTFPLIAKEGNTAPFIYSSPLTKVTVGTPYTYDVDAVDPEGDPLTYTLTQAPSDMTIDSLTGEIDWIAKGTTPFGTGSVSVTVNVDDGTFSDTQTFTIQVIPHMYARTALCLLRNGLPC